MMRLVRWLAAGISSQAASAANDYCLHRLMIIRMIYRTIFFVIIFFPLCNESSRRSVCGSFSNDGLCYGEYSFYSFFFSVFVYVLGVVLVHAHTFLWQYLSCLIGQSNWPRVNGHASTQIDSLNGTWKRVDLGNAVQSSISNTSTV